MPPEPYGPVSPTRETPATLHQDSTAGVGLAPVYGIIGTMASAMYSIHSI